MTTQKFIHPSRSTLVTLLATLIGLSATLGCSVPTTPSNASTDSSIANETQSGEGTQTDRATEVDTIDPDPTVAVAVDDSLPEEAQASTPPSADMPTVKQDSIEPATLATVYLPDLEQAKGASYSVVRSQLVANGWMPHTFATNGPVGNANDPGVRQMQELGFEEVKECSGTGQGFCLSQFVHRDRLMNGGSVLVVITAAAAPGGAPDSGPIFWDFRVDEVSDTTYIDRQFDRALFNQLQEEESFCLGVGRCESVQYQLKDALLIGGSYDFGTTKTTLILQEPVSQEEAIAIAKILDAQSSIDFADAEVFSQNNTQSYIRRPELSPGVAPGSAPIVRLVFTDSGKVSEISFSMRVL